MFVYCNVCNYDSGDYDNCIELAEIVNDDGGQMMISYDENGKPRGWDIQCPNCHYDNNVHID